MDPLISNEVRQSLEFKQLNRVEGSVLDNSFYTAPSEAADSLPGSLLRLERNIDPSKYLLPATIALLLIVY